MTVFVNLEIEIFFSFEEFIILSSISVIFLTYETLEYFFFKILYKISKTTIGLALPI